ncbi:hypothetical protein [Lysinibacter sp. HNR]|uniref:DUF7341 domain-containing protein n=1 Tax=Lysinibacter sp. HNR TaxID=3031408 RepID=UPI002434CD88|nr:hypothetical protein [Lysinibacter sp. HNR]WGD36646.1 hypothetical protein FrondiHNR_09260 [Lysinibacter sp. HNR]
MDRTIEQKKEDNGNDLREAVKALTEPICAKFIRDDGTVMVGRQNPLLEQLETAIRGSGIGAGRSQAIASERSVLDAQALFEFQQIRDQLRGWLVDAEREIDGDICGSLQRWYVAWVVKRPAAKFYLSELRRWKTVITSVVDPPRQMDHPSPCPECGATVWLEELSKEERQRPLAIFYRENESIETANAKCRACGKKWTVLELAQELANSLVS